MNSFQASTLPTSPPSYVTLVQLIFLILNAILHMNPYQVMLLGPSILVCCDFIVRETQG
jgi:hypothetical protein